MECPICLSFASKYAVFLIKSNFLSDSGRACLFLFFFSLFFSEYSPLHHPNVVALCQSCLYANAFEGNIRKVLAYVFTSMPQNPRKLWRHFPFCGLEPQVSANIESWDECSIDISELRHIQAHKTWNSPHTDNFFRFSFSFSLLSGHEMSRAQEKSFALINLRRLFTLRKKLIMSPWYKQTQVVTWAVRRKLILESRVSYQETIGTVLFIRVLTGFFGFLKCQHAVCVVFVTKRSCFPRAHLRRARCSEEFKYLEVSFCLRVFRVSK